MTPKAAASLPELAEVIRNRRDELGLTHMGLDDLCGYADGYTSKLLAPEPMKNFGEMSLATLLSALALKVTLVVIDEDAHQAALMRKRWQQRQRRTKPVRRKHSTADV